MFKNFNHISDLPAILPVFPLRGALLLPSTQIPLHIFEPRYLEMVEHVLRTHRLIALVQPDPNESAGGDRQGLARIGCLGQLTSWQVTGERSCDIGLAGMIRFELEEEVHIDTSFRQIQVNYEAFAEDLHGQDQSGGIDRKKFVEKLQIFTRQQGLEFDWEAIEEIPDSALVDAAAALGPFEPAEQQALLEARSVQERADIVTTLIDISLAGEQGKEERVH